MFSIAGRVAGRVVGAAASKESNKTEAIPRAMPARYPRCGGGWNGLSGVATIAAASYASRPSCMKIIALINAKAGSLAPTPNFDQTEHITAAFAAERVQAAG